MSMFGDWEAEAFFESQPRVDVDTDNDNRLQTLMEEEKEQSIKLEIINQRFGEIQALKQISDRISTAINLDYSGDQVVMYLMDYLEKRIQQIAKEEVN